MIQMKVCFSVFGMVFNKDAEYVSQVFLDCESNQFHCSVSRRFVCEAPVL